MFISYLREVFVKASVRFRTVLYRNAGHLERPGSNQWIKELSQQNRVVWKAQSCVFPFLIYHHPVRCIARQKVQTSPRCCARTRPGGRDQIGRLGRAVRTYHQIGARSVPEWMSKMCKKIRVLYSIITWCYHDVIMMLHVALEWAGKECPGFSLSLTCKKNRWRMSEPACKWPSLSEDIDRNVIILCGSNPVSFMTTESPHCWKLMMCHT